MNRNAINSSLIVLLLVQILLFPSIDLFAQVKHFEMPLYFEDAVGNKDTIIWGYDSRTGYNVIDTKLGEDIINTPLDSIFDIRIGKSTFNDEPPLGKKRFAYANIIDGERVSFGGIFIIIQVKHNPIKVTYNATLLQNDNVCMENTLVLYDPSVYLVNPPWWNAPDDSWDCLASQNEFYIDTRTYYDVSSRNYMRDYPVVNKGILPIPTIQLKNSCSGPCKFYVRTADVLLPLFTFYPNPTHSQLTIDATQSYNAVRVYSIEGKLMQYLDRQGNTIDISSLPSGMYFFELLEGQKPVTRKEKFVKIQ